MKPVNGALKILYRVTKHNSNSTFYWLFFFVYIHVSRFAFFETFFAELKKVLVAYERNDSSELCEISNVIWE